MAFALIALSVISADAAETDCMASNIAKYAECARSKLAILDADLKTVYSHLVTKAAVKESIVSADLGAVSRVRPEKSKSAWVDFRAANCLLRGAEM